MPSFKRKALFECFDRTDLLDDESQMDSCSQTIGRSLTSSKQIKRREKEADKCKKIHQQTNTQFHRKQDFV